MEKQKQGLKAGHLVMLALGTVIGGSFFLGSSVAVNAAGPSIIFAFIFGGILVYYILYALSELTVAYPDCGSFRTFATKAFGERTGFVTGWIYWTGMVLALSSEATAAAILLRQWLPAVPLSVFGSLILIVVTLLNLLGADWLSRLESALSGIKLLTVVAFILIAVFLVFGLFAGRPGIGLGAVAQEPFAPGGITGLLGSMLIVLFTYCGFEVIGFAAPDVRDVEKTVPRAIRMTVFCLLGLYLLYIIFLLPLIPTAQLNENTSAIVASLSRHGINQAGTVIMAVVVTAIVSTMLATLFGLGRVMRSMVDGHQAPAWLRDRTDVAYRGILASGALALVCFWFGLLLPQVFLFLLSSAGFATLFTYAVIMACHLRLRRRYGCPPSGKCQMPGFPYTSIFTLVSLIVAILSMPFVRGQTSGLIAGIVLVGFFELSYSFMKFFRSRNKRAVVLPPVKNPGLAAEFSEELTDTGKKDGKDKF